MHMGGVGMWTMKHEAVTVAHFTNFFMCMIISQAMLEVLLT